MIFMQYLQFMTAIPSNSLRYGIKRYIAQPNFETMSSLKLVNRYQVLLYLPWKFNNQTAPLQVGGNTVECLGEVWETWPYGSVLYNFMVWTQTALGWKSDSTNITT